MPAAVVLERRLLVERLAAVARKRLVARVREHVAVELGLAQEPRLAQSPTWLRWAAKSGLVDAPQLRRLRCASARCAAAPPDALLWRGTETTGAAAAAPSGTVRSGAAVALADCIRSVLGDGTPKSKSAPNAVGGTSGDAGAGTMGAAESTGAARPRGDRRRPRRHRRVQARQRRRGEARVPGGQRQRRADAVGHGERVENVDQRLAHPNVHQRLSQVEKGFGQALLAQHLGRLAAAAGRVAEAAAPRAALAERRRRAQLHGVVVVVGDRVGAALAPAAAAPVEGGGAAAAAAAAASLCGMAAASKSAMLMSMKASSSMQSAPRSGPEMYSSMRRGSIIAPCGPGWRVRRRRKRRARGARLLPRKLEFCPARCERRGWTGGRRAAGCAGRWRRLKRRPRVLLREKEGEGSNPARDPAPRGRPGRERGCSRTWVLPGSPAKQKPLDTLALELCFCFDPLRKKIKRSPHAHSCKLVLVVRPRKLQ